MSYEGRHWACGRDRSEPHDDCKQCHSKYDPKVDDCHICGGVSMICDCGPEEDLQWRREHHGKQTSRLVRSLR